MGLPDTAVPAPAALKSFSVESSVSAQPAQPPPPAVALPNREGSLKFAVLGDFGTGDRPQYQVGEQMAKLHERFPFELVITVGDNIYGGRGPDNMKRKFEAPYKALLDAGVKFYASLGNHDDRDQSRYALFNMEGRTYYSFKAPKQDVRFFALESDYPRPQQIAWLEKELESLARGLEDSVLPPPAVPRRACTDRRKTSARFSSRSSSSTTSAWCSPDTSISTNGSNLRRASCTS